MFWQAFWSKPVHLGRVLGTTVVLERASPAQQQAASSKQQPATASRRRLPAWPCDWLPCNAAPRSGRGGPRLHGVAPKTSQDHSWGRGLAGLTLP